MPSAIFLLLLLALVAPGPALSESTSEALIISGGIDRESNHVRYENNVRLYSNILEEGGYTRANTKVLFNEGAGSEVTDPDSLNESASARFGVPSAFKNTFRKNNIADIIDGPANQKSVAGEFSRLEKSANAGALKKVLLFSTDHGTANSNDFSKSYISLTGADKLTYEAQDNFVGALNRAGAKAILVGDQCYSGHNMGIALKNPNACAFSSTAPFESSYSLTRELDDIKKPVAKLGYTTYAYFFGCALHKPGTDNQAEQDCDRVNADFNKDGKVSFAEAHNFALARMDPQSVPQISSQVYARSLQDSNAAGKLFDPSAVAECFTGEEALSRLAKDMGKLVNPALNLAIKDRLAMQQGFLQWLMKDPDFLTVIKANAADSPESKAEKVEAAFQKFEQAHAKIVEQLKAGLTARNEARNRREAMRSEVEAQLSQEAGSKISAQRAKMEAAAAELEKDLTPAKRQQIQNAYTRANQEIKFRVDKALEEPARAAAYAALKAEIEKLEEARQDLQTDLANNLSAGGEVRRYHQAYRGYQAEVAVLTNGSPAQKTKLVQLYECENETL